MAHVVTTQIDLLPQWASSDATSWSSPKKLSQKLGKAAARKLKKDAGEEKEALKIMNLQFFGRKWEV